MSTTSPVLAKEGTRTIRVGASGSIDEQKSAQKFDSVEGRIWKLKQWDQGERTSHQSCFELWLIA
jgi:hypothetical protein